MGNQNLFNIIWKLTEKHRAKSRNKKITESSLVWHRIHTSESTNEKVQKAALFGIAYILQKVLMKKYRTFNVRSNFTRTINCNYTKAVDRFRWPHDLRSWSATAQLLGLRVRISLGYKCLLWMLCLVQIVASATDRFLVQESSTDCVGVNECDQLRRWFGRSHIKKE